MAEQFPYEVENVFLNFNTFFGFMILIVIFDGFVVLVIRDDPALSHCRLAGIADHVFDNLILSGLFHISWRSVDIEAIGIIVI